MNFVLSRTTALLLVSLAISFAGCNSGGSNNTLGIQQKSELVFNLEDGESQTVVTFGTSLTHIILSNWVQTLDADLDARFPGQTTVINRAFGQTDSIWALAVLDVILGDAPDSIFIEFAINDAQSNRGISLAQSEANLDLIIDRILDALPNCEIILMTMNPPVRESFEQRPRYKEYYQVYRDVAQRRDLLLIDHEANWDELLDEQPNLFDLYVPDTVHPNEQGSLAIITPEINKGIGLERHLTRFQYVIKTLLSPLPF